MPQSTAQPGSQEQETKQHMVNGVQVYSRLDHEGKPRRLDAIDQDEGKIRQIADLLQRRGFGIMRQRNPRAGKIFYRFKALWAGRGEPPEDPLSGH